MLRTVSGRFAALYTLLFAVAVATVGAVTMVSTRALLAQQLDAHIRVEATALATEYRTEGLDEVIQAVSDRDDTPGALDYGIENPGRKPVAGRLAGLNAPDGWSEVRLEHTAEKPELIRVFATHLPDGHRLLVGDDLQRMRDVDRTILAAFGWAFLGVLLLGGAAGYMMHRDGTRRLAAISGTADAIIRGDLSRRVPVQGDNDDLDQLALTINRMLDRIGALMESLRQVSNDIAHDLRTPLARLRQQLEAEIEAKPGAERRVAVEGAIEELDAILETFAALLRIAEIEAGARRAGFRSVDLTERARTVVDAFAPAAEEGGRSLSLVEAGPAWIDGDPELLIQMLVNLVENALTHTPAGASVSVETGSRNGRPVALVRDNGPGVPASERARVFDRFYRLERSRTTPGNGLGLSLAAAIAKLHGAEISLHDLSPGLEVRIVFPARP